MSINIYLKRTKSKLNTQNGVHINDDLICCRKCLPCTFSCKKVIKTWIFKNVSKILKAWHFFKHRIIFKSFDLGVATWMQCMLHLWNKLKSQLNWAGLLLWYYSYINMHVDIQLLWQTVKSPWSKHSTWRHFLHFFCILKTIQTKKKKKHKCWHNTKHWMNTYLYNMT